MPSIGPSGIVAPSRHWTGWTRSSTGSVTGSPTRVPPETYFVGSAVFHYLGPAFAVLLFALVPPLGVAWLRIASAAAIFAALAPAVARAAGGSMRADAGSCSLFGATLGTMNACFYLAIDRLPLGTVAAIEFLPVIALAALGLRTARNMLALGRGRGGRVPPDGRPARRRSRSASPSRSRTPRSSRSTSCSATASRGCPSLGGIDGLAAAMLVALLVATPIGGWAAAPAFARAGRAPRRHRRRRHVVRRSRTSATSSRWRGCARETYALLVSLLPATATVIGARRARAGADAAGARGRRRSSSAASPLHRERNA